MLSLFIFLLLTSLSSKANDQTGDPALIIVPSYEHPLVSRYLPGSKRTLVAPALVSRSGEITYLTPNDISAPEAWDRFIKLAKELSSLQLATLDPEMIRDEHGVIQMAVIHSDKPITAALILLPGFLDHFSAIFGPELLITIPTQNKICVFPKLANHLPQLTEAIRDDYLISSAQASTEIFELNRNGLHAVGSIDPDDE
jgi:hypothetical protein